MKAIVTHRNTPRSITLVPITSTVTLPPPRPAFSTPSQAPPSRAWSNLPCNLDPLPCYPPTFAFYIPSQIHAPLTHHFLTNRTPSMPR
ncbi:hypothetical protein E2C01_050256 [Portunus trituberculatus]|uniref:Uncharacterized protein n=1 Tax=Portunus trituberculatus TaxID=210409 RepID=A0A5B7GG14_PORTR|nr:hypothetical protein [Portunus trituberculatus]